MTVTDADARAALVAGNGRTDVATWLYVSIALGASLAASPDQDQPTDQTGDQ